MTADQIEIKNFTFKGRHLVEEESKALIGLIMVTKKHDIEVPLNEDTESSDWFPSKVFLKRIEAYKLPFQVSNLFFAMSIATWVNTPACVMILLRLVYQQWKETGKTYFTIDDWAGTFFPIGVPTEDEQNVWWESQKSSGEFCVNMIDNSKYWM